jgi:hypothetical protein
VINYTIRLFSSFVLLFTISSARSQANRDYIIKLSKDTVFTKVVRIDKEMKSVVCEEKDKKIKFEAKNILAVKCDTNFYETGLVALKHHGSKQYLLLQRTVKGNLNLYEINVKRNKFLWKIFGDDFIHFRWVYRAHDWIKGVTNSVSFYKKENEGQDKFSKSWKEKCMDCKLLQDKINSKTTPWTPTPKELVQFYNNTCK